MKIRGTRLRQWPVLLVSIFLFACDSADDRAGESATDQPSPRTIRLATYNASMGMPGEGDLSRALAQPDNPQLRALAAIIQQVRPDILVLNEFDYDPGVDAPALLHTNFLQHGQDGQNPIDFPWSFRAPSNTGIDSELDLDGNGVLGEATDAWGFGTFPGQYGTLVLSRFPIDEEVTRTFQMFRWTELPDARAPHNPDGSDYYPEDIWRQLRLASKSYWDISLDIDGRTLHLLTFHPTPPVFDGPEDRNGVRNFEELRLWAEYLAPETAGYIVDDQGRSGGLGNDQAFVIAGDFNSDPLDGDSLPGAVNQLLDYPRIDSSCVPVSEGGPEAAKLQGGLNTSQRGDPATDTSDFNDEFTGNLRLDYLLPSVGLKILGCGVFWPRVDEPESQWMQYSDHRMVWLDLEF